LQVLSWKLFATVYRDPGSTSSSRENNARPIKHENYYRKKKERKDEGEEEK
jgi:hypothetical protein